MAYGTLCPHWGSPEGQALLEAAGGDLGKAQRIYMEHNGYPDYVIARANGQAPLAEDTEQPADPSHLDDKEVILTKAKTVLNKKIGRLKRAVEKYPDQEQKVKELEALLKELDNLEVEAALITFIKAADSMLNSAEASLKKLEDDPDNIKIGTLHRIEEYTRSLDILQNLKEDFFDDPEHIEDFALVSKIASKRLNIKKRHLDLARKYFAKKWAPNFGKIKAQYRQDAERAFKKIDPDTGTSVQRMLKQKGYSKQEIQQAKEEFIENWLMNNAEKITRETEEYVRKLLVQTVDISKSSTWFVNPKDIGHDIISEIVQMLDEQDFSIKEKTVAATDDLEILNKAFVRHVGKRTSPKEQYASLFARNEQGDILPIMVNPLSVNWQDFQRQYKGTPVWELHQKLTDIIKEKDSLVPLKLGFSLPSLNKGTIERLSENGLIDTFKEGFIDHFTVREEDTEFGQVPIENLTPEQKAARKKDRRKEKQEKRDKATKEVLASESGKEREVIPLHYRYPISDERRSFDLPSLILLDYHNSLNYKAKTDAAIQLETLKDVVANANIIQRTEGTKATKVDYKDNMPLWSQGQGSNLEKVINSIIRHRLYGIQIEGDPNLAKKVTALKNYTSIVGLSANFLSGTANWIHGTTMSIIESTGENTGYYNKGNRAYATKVYSTDVHRIMADAGQRVPTSKTNLLIRKFDAFSDWRALDKKFVENNRGKRLADIGSLMFLNQASEHAVQSVVMYSILNNIKVKDAKGNYLTKDFTPTTDKSKAIGVDQAYVLKDGKMKMHEKVASTDKTDGVAEKDMFKISQIIKRANRDLYGNYDNKNKATLQRTWLGTLMYNMRGWLLPGIQKRWRGIGTVGQSAESLRLDQKSYNKEIEAFEDGIYTTTIRFMKDLLYDVKALKLLTVKQNFEQLTDAEQAAIKKTIMEAAMIAAAFLVFAAFKEGEEPEDAYAAFLARRLYSELYTYADPREAVRTFRSPMVALNTVENALDFGFQLVHPTERYKTGRRAGELKLKRRGSKLIPIWKHLDSDINDKLSFYERN